MFLSRICRNPSFQCVVWLRPNGTVQEKPCTGVSFFVNLQHFLHRNQVYQSTGSLIPGALVKFASVWEALQCHKTTMLPCRVFPALCHLASAKAHIGSKHFYRFLKENGTPFLHSSRSRITQSRHGRQDVTPLSHNTKEPRVEFSKRVPKCEDVVWK